MNFEIKEKQNASRSDEQLQAEKCILEEANRIHGLSLKQAPIDLTRLLDGNKKISVMLDGVDRENRVICEIYAHIGPLKGGQPGKIAKDILKLHLVGDFFEKNGEGQWRKYIFFADNQAKKLLDQGSSSWLAHAAKNLEIQIEVIALPQDLHYAVLAAQTRQKR